MAEKPGDSADYIFPVIASSEFTLANTSRFQPLLYKPLYQTHYSNPAVDFADSIGNAPVWSHRDTVITITMKHYIWSNGQPVTSRDVQFFINLARAAGPDWGGYEGNAEFPFNLKSVVLDGPYRLTLTLARPYNPTYYLDNWLTYITPLPQLVWDRESLTGRVGNYDLSPSGARKVYEFLNSYAGKLGTYTEHNRIWGVVDGAFRLASFGGSSSPDIFIPNPRYSGHRAQIAKFEEIPFTSDDAEYDVLRSGSGALSIGNVPFGDRPTLPAVRAAGYNIVREYDWASFFLVINMANPVMGPVFRQLYVRQALAHLIDQGAMIRDFMGGYGVADYGPVPIEPNNSFSDRLEARDPYPYSVTDATRLLRAHGWVERGGVDVCSVKRKCGKGIATGTRLDLDVLYYSGSTSTTQSMELFASDAAKAGVHVTLREESVGTVVAIVDPCTPGRNGETVTSPECTWQLGDYDGLDYSSDPTGGYIFLPSSSGNSGLYVSKTATTLINETHYSASSSAIYAYENYIERQVPVLFLPTPVSIGAVARDLRGPGTDSVFGNTDPNRWYYVK